MLGINIIDMCFYIVSDIAVSEGGINREWVISMPTECPTIGFKLAAYALAPD